MTDLAPDSNSKPTRRPRSDGERNRTRLVEAAKNAFAERGAGASLEQIARDANVSIASLYRHFPTRDEMISAVYRQEVDALIEAADRLATETEPIMALREWLLLFVEFLDVKHGMADAMNTLIGGPEDLYGKTPDRLVSPITTLVRNAINSGSIRDDVEPLDLLRALAGVANVRPTKTWKQSTLRMVELLLDGMKERTRI
jgi:AcrR family transcriptional regulator